MKSAAITHLNQRLVLTFAMVAVIAGIYFLMRRGWLRQMAAQSDLPSPPPIEDLPAQFHGIYVSTTFADQPLRRIVAHGMGVRSAVAIAIGPTGIGLSRQGATSFSIPVSTLVGISRASGMAGKVVGGEGLIVLRWRLGSVEVETGLLVLVDRDQLIAQLEDLL